ncbi:hypothetical protein AUP68_13996 [Ilyonectria robusta]
MRGACDKAPSHHHDAFRNQSQYGMGVPARSGTRGWKSAPTVTFATSRIFKWQAPDHTGLRTKMATTSKTIEETATRFENLMQDLKKELCETELSIEDESIRDDWDMKTLLIMLSECLVIMGVFFEATGTCVKMYGCRIRLASKHKATGATSEGSSVPGTRTSHVVSYPELPLTKIAAPESNGQIPEAAIPPPGRKRGRKPKPNGPTMTDGHCGLQPLPTLAVPTPDKPLRRSTNSQPNPPPEPPASQEGKETQQCIAKEESQPRPRTEVPAAEEGKGLTAKARRGTPKKKGAEEGKPPVRRSARQQAARLNG